MACVSLEMLISSQLIETNEQEERGRKQKLSAEAQRAHSDRDGDGKNNQRQTATVSDGAAADTEIYSRRGPSVACRCGAARIGVAESAEWQLTAPWNTDRPT